MGLLLCLVLMFRNILCPLSWYASALPCISSLLLLPAGRSTRGVATILKDTFLHNSHFKQAQRHARHKPISLSEVRCGLSSRLEYSNPVHPVSVRPRHATSCSNHGTISCAAFIACYATIVLLFESLICTILKLIPTRPYLWVPSMLRKNLLNRLVVTVNPKPHNQSILVEICYFDFLKL